MIKKPNLYNPKILIKYADIIKKEFQKESIYQKICHVIQFKFDGISLIAKHGDDDLVGRDYNKYFFFTIAQGHINFKDGKIVYSRIVEDCSVFSLFEALDKLKYENGKWSLE